MKKRQHSASLTYQIWPSLRQHLQQPRWWRDILLTAGLYTLACWLVLYQLPIINANDGSPVWPGAGVTVGGLLAWGRSRWFGVLLGALIVNVFLRPDPLWGDIIGSAGILVGVWLTVVLMEQLGGRQLFAKVQQAVAFTLCAFLTGTLLQSLVGVSVVFANTGKPWQEFGQFFTNWWIGDSIGVLVIAPLFVAWGSPQVVGQSASVRGGEFFALLLSLGLISYAVFLLEQPLEYLYFLPILWSAFRFGHRVTVSMTAIVATVAAILTSYKLGVFFRIFEQSQSLLLFQMFVGVLAGTSLAVLGIVSENQAAQERLHRLNADLEQRVLERTKSLQESETHALGLATKAEAANKAKSAFIANMSHELRSPLNAVIGFSQLMLRSKDLPPDHYENAGIIYRSGDYLLTLINNILDLSKIEAQKATLNPHNFDLHRLLADLEDMLHLRAANAGLDLTLEYSAAVPQYVTADETKLRQVLINLLSNAIKFTPQGRAWLTVDAHTRQDEHYELAITVGDTGVGMAAAELAELFQPFSQGQAGREKQEGTGLGLSITQKFIQLMGGSISVESQPGRGTQFYITLPVMAGRPTLAAMAEGHPPVLGLAPNQPTYRLLVVDDKAVNRQLLVKLLQPLGFEVQEAANGQEAIACWETWEPHLIWMDMRMPIMDGYEATKYIKSTTKGNATAVVALTASVLEEEQAIILSAGCDDFLRKPFNEHVIFETLRKHLGVEFIYEEPVAAADDSTQAATPLVASQLAHLSQEAITDLYLAALEANTQRFVEQLEHLPSLTPAQKTRLATMARQFQFEAIIDLLEPLAADVPES